MAKEQIGFIQGAAPVEKPYAPWKNGFFSFTEQIVPGVEFRYNCKYERKDVTATAPQVQSTPRLTQQEVESRFASFMASNDLSS